MTMCSIRRHECPCVTRVGKHLLRLLVPLGRHDRPPPRITVQPSGTRSCDRVLPMGHAPAECLVASPLERCRIVLRYLPQSVTASYLREHAARSTDIHILLLCISHEHTSLLTILPCARPCSTTAFSELRRSRLITGSGLSTSLASTVIPQDQLARWSRQHGARALFKMDGCVVRQARKRPIWMEEGRLHLVA